MQNDEAEDLWLRIQENLSDRGCFNGIDDATMEELSADLIGLIRREAPSLKGGPIPNGDRWDAA